MAERIIVAIGHDMFKMVSKMRTPVEVKGSNEARGYLSKIEALLESKGERVELLRGNLKFLIKESELRKLIKEREDLNDRVNLVAVAIFKILISQ